MPREELEGEVGRTSAEVKEEMDEAMANTEPLISLAEGLVETGVREAARESGRTVEEQWERMGDGYAYQGAEMNPYQKQLDDYAITGEFVEVRP